VLVLALAGVFPADDAVPAAPLPPNQILVKMAAMDRARMAGLKEYTSTRLYALENKRFKTKAAMRVKMQYSLPGKKEFTVISESGARVICQKVFRRMVDSELEASTGKVQQQTKIIPENYEFRYIGVQPDRGRMAYVFAVSPKVRHRYSIEGRVFIDAIDFAITRIEGQPAKNPSFWVRSSKFVQVYQKFGPFWLPESNASETDVVLFGQTDVDIRYSDYIIKAVDGPSLADAQAASGAQASSN